MLLIRERLPCLTRSVSPQFRIDVRPEGLSGYHAPCAVVDTRSPRHRRVCRFQAGRDRVAVRGIASAGPFCATPPDLGTTFARGFSLRPAAVMGTGEVRRCE